MSKRIRMDRERFQAMPVILAAARAATRHVPMDAKQAAELERALGAFREAPSAWERDR